MKSSLTIILLFLICRVVFANDVYTLKIDSFSKPAEEEYLARFSKFSDYVLCVKKDSLYLYCIGSFDNRVSSNVFLEKLKDNPVFDKLEVIRLDTSEFVIKHELTTALNRPIKKSNHAPGPYQLVPLKLNPDTTIMLKISIEADYPAGVGSSVKLRPVDRKSVV